MLHTHEVEGSSPPVSTKEKIRTVRFGFFLYRMGTRTSVATVRWTVACRRLDGGYTIIFAKQKCKRVPQSPPKKKIRTVRFGFFLYRMGTRTSVTTVRWTVACRRLDGGYTIIFAKQKCKRVPQSFLEYGHFFSSQENPLIAGRILYGCRPGAKIKYPQPAGWPLKHIPHSAGVDRNTYQTYLPKHRLRVSWRQRPL